MSVIADVVLRGPAVCQLQTATRMAAITRSGTFSGTGRTDQNANGRDGWKAAILRDQKRSLSFLASRYPQPAST